MSASTRVAARFCWTSALPLLLLFVALASVVVMSCSPRAAWAQTATSALTNLTQTGLDHGSATYTVSVDTTLATNGGGDSAFSPSAASGVPPLAYYMTGLPLGLTFNAATRRLTGTPTSGGDFTVTYTVTDANNASDSVDFLYEIDGAATATAPMVGNQRGLVGTALSIQLPVAAAGDTPITYAASGLPPGLSFSSSTRTLSGTPTKAGTYTVTDDDGDSDSSTFNYTIAADLTPSLPTLLNRTGTQGTALSVELQAASGGNRPLTYSVSGLPPGLSFTPATRNVSGTPTKAGTYTVTYTVSDNDGDSDRDTFTWTIAVNAAPAFGTDKTTRDVAENQVAGTNVGAPVTATDADKEDTVTYSITGSNPGGFTVTQTGQIRTGQVLDHEATGSYTITLQASDSKASDTIQVTITVVDLNDPPVFARDSLTLEVDENTVSGGMVGRSAVAASDQDGDPLTYSLTGSSLFQAVAGGVIQVADNADLDFETQSGYVLTLTARDGAGAQDTIEVIVTVRDVNEAPVFALDEIDLTVPENSPEGTNVGLPVTASDQDGDQLAYSISGSVFRIVQGSGQIQVAPNSVLDYGTTPRYTVTVTARDPSGATDTVTVNIVLGNLSEARVTGVSVSDVGETSATVTVSLSNQHSERATVHLRYRTPPGSGSWTATSANTSGTSVSFSLTGLTGGVSYRTEASTDASFGGAVTGSFTTRRAPPSVEISFSPTSDVSPGTEITVTVELGGLRLQTNSGITYRLDVENSDLCEGNGMGAVRSLATINQDPERVKGTILPDCHAGFHTLQFRLFDGSALWVSRDYDFVIRSPQATAAPTAIPDADVQSSATHAYLTTIHLVVGSSGSTHGYVANDYGGLTAGRLPGVLFADGRDRGVGQLTVNTGGQLKLTYADEEGGLFHTPEGLEWLRLQLRGADNSIIAEGPLWQATACDDRSLCLDLGSHIVAHNGQPVGVDFFDAVREVLEAAPGGKENIVILAGATGNVSTGLDQSNGNWIGGSFPREWFSDGMEKPVDSLIVRHGPQNRRLELVYGTGQTTGQWKYDPDAYRKFRLVLRNRDGEELFKRDMQDALAAMTEAQRRCGDSNAARRLCLDYQDDDLDLSPYQGQVLLLQVEDITWLALLKKTPGGPVGGQLGLGLFGACMFGITFRKSKSPQREWIILAAGAVSSALLPAFGWGDPFWAGGIVLIAVLAGGGWFWVTRSR